MSQDENAVNEVVETPTETDSAPVENKEVAEEKDVMEMSLDELDPASTVSDAEEQSEAPAEEPTQEAPEASEGEQPLKPEEEWNSLSGKAQDRFRQKANEARELREQLVRLQTQETQVATEQELMNQVNPETGDYYTPQEAERIARYQANETLSQTISEERYMLEVQQNQQNIASEAAGVLDIPLFNPSSPDYNAELSAQYDQLLEQSLIRDNERPEIDPQTGQPTGRGLIIGATHSPLQLAKIIADATKLNTPKIQAQAQKATEKMLANADRLGGASQATKTKVDPLMEAFDLEAAR